MEIKQTYIQWKTNILFYLFIDGIWRGTHTTFSFFFDSAACVHWHCVLRQFTVISQKKVEAVLYSLPLPHNQMKAVHVLCMELEI